jgi:hypothetical protein
MELTQEYFDQQLKGLATKADFDSLKTFIQQNVALKDDVVRQNSIRLYFQ